MTTDIRIYVADLAAYSAGHLHGVWIDATQDVSDIQAEVTKMLKASPIADAEEYAIHDHEGFDGYQLSEHAGIDTAHNVACFIQEYPEFGGALLSHFNGDIGSALSAAEGGYRGRFDSLADFAQELAEETITIPEAVRWYIDYASMARDMEVNGDFFAIETGCLEEVHIFWSH